MLSYILIVIIAYLLGNISTSYIIAKKMMGVDKNSGIWKCGIYKCT